MRSPLLRSHFSLVFSIDSRGLVSSLSDCVFQLVFQHPVFGLIRYMLCFSALSSPPGFPLLDYSDANIVSHQFPWCFNVIFLLLAHVAASHFPAFPPLISHVLVLLCLCAHIATMPMWTSTGSFSCGFWGHTLGLPGKHSTHWGVRPPGPQGFSSSLPLILSLPTPLSQLLYFQF